jgi:carboxyl-terminal processing protease
MKIIDRPADIRRRSLIVALVVVLQSLWVPTSHSAQAQNDTRTFPETNQTVSGVFLSYWNSHGGLAQQGYPISGEMEETSDTDGKTYKVQYFERAVFEAHPENKTPYDVLLSLLGDSFYKQKYPGGAPGQTADNSPGTILFSQTGKHLGGVFLSYWNAHGGLAQQGYPISDEFSETSDTDGKTYTVQYFERAVFEYHPENKAPNDVLLSLLGTFRYQARYGAEHTHNLSASQRLNLLETVWSTVRDDYIYRDFRGLNWQAVHDEYKTKIAAAADDQAVYNLVAEMIDSLHDGHSAFLNPEEVAQDDALRTGDLTISGIGVLSQEISSTVRIVYVIPGGPADKAGLRAFDTIRAVNGTPLLHNADAPYLIRGPPKTSVTLTIESPGKPPRDVIVIRDMVTFAFHATAKRWADTNVAYLNLPTFDVPGIANEAANALNSLAATGPLDGVIIDLRQNGGGLISELNSMLGLFIDGGNGGYDVTLNGRNANTIPSGHVLSALKDKPVVVLTSGGSESASERFAAVMQDYGRATILGTTTAGNTETVYQHDMPYGTRLSLAQATYLRTDGKTSIEDKGVVPDVVLDVPWYTYPPDQDPQIVAAVQRIEQK